MRALVTLLLTGSPLIVACGEGAGTDVHTGVAPTGDGPRYARRSPSIDPARTLPTLHLTGTRVTLAPPGGFEPAPTFLGFHRADLSASILVDENAVALEETLSGLTEDALERAGLVLLERESIHLGEHVALVLSLRQDLLEGRAPLMKLLVVMGDEQSTLTVTLVYPVAQEGLLEGPMRDAARSVRWDPSLPLDPLGGLRFSIEPPAPFSLSHRSQNQVHYAPGGWTPDDPARPRLVAGPTVVDGDLERLGPTAEQRMRETNGVTHLELQRSEGVPVDSRTGWECVATALDTATREPLVLYQLVVLDGDDAFLVKGRAPREQQSEWLPRLEAAARSLRARR